MSKISAASRTKMINSYRHDVACYLAKLAHRGSAVTYADLSKQFGGTPRGWGNILGGIAIRCHKEKLPILSVLVVAKRTGMPSVDAVLYDDLGLRSLEDIKEEQRRCHSFDWSSTNLWK